MPAMRYDEVSIIIRETLGRNIKALRQASGVSQAAFARMVSVDRSYVNQIEAGKENITVDILVKFADGLDVPITALFAGLDENPPRELPNKGVSYFAASVPKR